MSSSQILFLLCILLFLYLQLYLFFSLWISGASLLIVFSSGGFPSWFRRLIPAFPEPCLLLNFVNPLLTLPDCVHNLLHLTFSFGLTALCVEGGSVPASGKAIYQQGTGLRESETCISSWLVNVICSAEKSQRVWISMRESWGGILCSEKFLGSTDLLQAESPNSYKVFSWTWDSSLWKKGCPAQLLPQNCRGFFADAAQDFSEDKLKVTVWSCCTKVL